MGRPWKKKISVKALLKRNPLPETPGVYFFFDAEGVLLYIGKATSLRDRVKSYFIQDMLETRGPKIHLMLSKIECVSFVKTDSVLEALLLESKLIREYQPPFNSAAKDDKSYNHIVITKEKFPRILKVRGRDLEHEKFKEPIKYLYGPFPEGGSLAVALRIIRQLFSYRDKCQPLDELTEKQKSKARACFSAQIGLCPGVCIGKISAHEYGHLINHIRLFFEGRKSQLLRELTREMKAAAKDMQFERAGEIKKTIWSLQHIQDMALIKDDLREESRHRVEAYDVAHLKGEQSVGVMTVVQNSRPALSEYRLFKLRGEHGGNDLSALQEILTRRFNHEEWPLPEFIVVDGALLQLGAAEAVLKEKGLTIPLVGVVKDERHKAARLEGAEGITGRFKKEIIMANAEAHRFAITFHRKRRSKEFLAQTSS